MCLQAPAASCAEWPKQMCLVTPVFSLCVWLTYTTSPPWAFHTKGLFCCFTLLFRSSTVIHVGKQQTQEQPPQWWSRHWCTLNLRGRELLLAFKELSRWLLMVTSKLPLQGFWPILSSCQGCVWELVVDPDLSYSSSLSQPTLHVVDVLASQVRLQVTPLPLLGDLLIPGGRPRLGEVNMSWWHARKESHAHLAVCTMHLPHLPEDTLVAIAGAQEDTAPMPEGILTNFGHVAAVTVREGTFPQGQVFPKFT